MSGPGLHAGASFLQSPIEYLKGVGTARADLLKKELGIFTFNDLLFHFPYRHYDRSRIHSISDITPDSAYIQLRGVVKNIRMMGQKRGQRLVADLYDSTGRLELVWFQGIKWVKEAIKEGKEYLVFGKPTEYNRTYNIAHPVLDDPEQSETKHYLNIMPFYTVTERMRTRSVDTRAIMKLTNALLSDPRFRVEENLPASLLRAYKLPDRQTALFQIHFPQSLEQLADAQRRLKFEELFMLQLRLLKYKHKREALYNGVKLELIGDNFNTFFNTHLPFELTGAQKRVIKEIRADVRSGKQMNRLLQGDVGSGKTVVALLIMLMALDNGYQACMMAPTEILAQQHFETISKLLGNMPVQVKLLTGSTSAKERREILDGLDSGEVQILIGTHALIEQDVKFSKLGIAVIDEQHRFGVEQRARLWTKSNRPPHVLVMTATPIPRTLAMTLYGDLDYSVIDELPVGRKSIRTMHKSETSRLQVYGFVKEEIAKGRQVYIVYPLISESEKMDYMNLMSGYEEILRIFPAPQYQVCMVHGKLKAADKDKEMKRFVEGKAQIMVATTVIEVGVNVPNASVMIIESAERFGLSQLHQLRGRVGRGSEQSYCVLMTGYKLGADARLRMKTMTETTDGFKIAEVDLKLRGPGALEGTQQSGVLDLKIAELSKDQAILAEARNAAEKILAVDPELAKPEHAGLKQFYEVYSRRNIWGRIS